MHGPVTPFANEIDTLKYRGEGESFRGKCDRITAALQGSPEHRQRLRDGLLNQRILPAGRIQSAVGSTRQVTAYNCFVSGTIADSFVHGPGSIMDRAKEAATTMRLGGGIGYDFSTLRPRGSLIKALQSQSSGPVSFMEVFDAVCRCTCSAGHRRGAEMGVLRVDHPDIEEFILAKQNDHRLTGFNISIAVTDAFMQAVKDGTQFPLVFEGQVHKHVDARALWEQIMRSTWDFAEPGVLFIDTINRMNNLWYCETIAATNPCGEQPLPPYGACLLGSLNLVKYLVRTDEKELLFDWFLFRGDIATFVEALDNVIDQAIYPLPEQEREAKSKRRMGIGVTGLANCAEALGHPYGSPSFLEFEREVLTVLRDYAYAASADLAAAKGAFPLYDERYLAGAYVQRLPTWVKTKILRHGIRNSHLTSIAPTGTISTTADNVSSGLEPVFSFEFDRTVIEPQGPRTETVRDYGLAFLGIRGKPCSEVTPREHVDVLCVAAELVDSAVSKTCNVPTDVDWEGFKEIYMRAWEGGAKGCTTYRVGGKRGAVLVAKEDTPKIEDPAMTCYIDTNTGRRECN